VQPEFLPEDLDTHYVSLVALQLRACTSEPRLQIMDELSQLMTYWRDKQIRLGAEGKDPLEMSLLLFRRRLGATLRDELNSHKRGNSARSRSVVSEPDKNSDNSLTPASTPQANPGTTSYTDEEERFLDCAKAAGVTETIAEIVIDMHGLRDSRNNTHGEHRLGTRVFWQRVREKIVPLIVKETRLSGGQWRDSLRLYFELHIRHLVLDEPPEILLKDACNIVRIREELRDASNSEYQRDFHRLVRHIENIHYLHKFIRNLQSEIGESADTSDIWTQRVIFGTDSKTPDSHSHDR
jgi:hypothetical protein